MLHSYRDHFGLTRDPFRMTPDPDFLFWSETHRAALSGIEDAIRRGHASVLLIGDPGTGKSTLLRHLKDNTDLRLHLGHAWHPMLLERAFHQAILEAFGIRARDGDEDGYRLMLDRHLRQQASLGNRSVLLVDEAQSLSAATVDRLTEFAERAPDCTVVLAAALSEENSFNECANPPQGPEIRLSRLTAAQTADYVRHRIRFAGRDKDIFEDAACAEIHRATGGIPRLVNTLCDECLFVAARQSSLRIDRALVASVALARKTGTSSLELPGRAAGPVRRRRSDVTGAAPQPPAEDQAPKEIAVAEPADATLPTRSVRTEPQEGGPSAGVPIERDRNPPAQLAETAYPIARVPPANITILPERQRRKRSGWMVAAAFCGGLFGGLALTTLVPLPWPGPSGGTPLPDRAAALAPPAMPAVPDDIVNFARDLPADPEDRFRLAVSLSRDAPERAVAAYSHAALRGHARAAYYLGQIYETGDGVPVDLSLAAAWYAAAADSLSYAQASLTGLPTPETGPMQPPLPLLGFVAADGMAELSWTSAPGPDPKAYVVELAGPSSPETLGSRRVRVSAAQLSVPDGATRWRIVATEPDGRQFQASGWQPLIRF